jgi:3-methyl-2-oxobutanoate hydroxymethyltransferase
MGAVDRKGRMTMQPAKVELCTLKKMKEEGRPITMITAYDYPTAKIVDAAGVDTVLVGDSLSNVVLGYPDTIPVTMEEMLHHVKAVARGIARALLIADMPFMSYNVSVERSIENAGRFMKEGRAQAVKIEGGSHVVDVARAMIRAGIPVVGHLGLTPQTANLLGGLHVQGKTANAGRKILEDALSLEEAGIFLLVLECVPSRLAKLIASRLKIPVVGIGAGAGCDGQVLVFHDLVGIDFGFRPKFVKPYAELGNLMQDAVGRYCAEVRERKFPDDNHSFTISDGEYDAIVQSIPVRGCQ